MASGRDMSVSHRKVRAWQLISLWWGCLPVISLSWAGSSLSYNLLWKHWGCSTKTEWCRVPVITKQWPVNVSQSNLNPFFKACSYLLSQMPVTNFVKATVLSTLWFLQPHLQRCCLKTIICFYCNCKSPEDKKEGFTSVQGFAIFTPSYKSR